jgi:Cysteine protease
VDWRAWNVVRPPKDQGKCGGDFAFSTAASAESQFAIKTGKLYDLSEQYLLDCDVLSGGCSGGWHESAAYLLSTSGAILEEDYPFVGEQQECREELVDNRVFKLQYPGIAPVEQSKDGFKAALRKGPIQVSFKVTNALFYQYNTGVLPADYCESDDGSLNHSMLALGYGIDSKGEYAII